MLHLFHLEFILDKLMNSASEVSDINMTVGHPIQVESGGELIPVYIEPEIRALTAYQTETLALSLLRGNRQLIGTLLDTGACDLSFNMENRGRFRVNIFSQQGRYSIVMRKIESYIKSIEELGLPETVTRLSKEKNGIILVTGATGTGKTTTLAAILDEINRSMAVHVVTLEDPVEFIHPAKMSTFNQRELGLDFRTFSEGLRSALRQAPKVILVGEMRDRETVEMALSAAETGHLVFSTLHTVDAGTTVNRIIGLFDSDEEKLIRVRLADSLRWVVSQRLLPKIGGGRVAALEIMGSNLLIKDIITNGEDAEKTFYNSIGGFSSMGWQTFDQHILDLYRQKVVHEDVALTYSSKKTVMSRGIDTIKAETGESIYLVKDLALEEVEEEDESPDSGAVDPQLAVQQAAMQAGQPGQHPPQPGQHPSQTGQHPPQPGQYPPGAQQAGGVKIHSSR
ncbi:MAG: PilT/PilU family type 4a pilus ATPase [Deltaproteobacteria bacterium]|jgi:twitching motility protein PilT|nr:PilT/PilU family type 4a pilus ATPase [Deltaproteobacteria bacterium]